MRYCYCPISPGANTSTASPTPLYTRNEAGKANLHFTIQTAEVHSVVSIEKEGAARTISYRGISLFILQGHHTVELYVSRDNDSWDEQSLICDPQELVSNFSIPRL